MSKCSKLSEKRAKKFINESECVRGIISKVSNIKDKNTNTKFIFKVQLINDQKYIYVNFPY